MPAAHRQDDARVCGATTVVVGQSTVFVNDKLWAVKGDIDSHGSGGLINSGTTVTINDIPVIVHAPDTASPDDLCETIGPPHCEPKTAGGSGDTSAY